MAGRFMAFVAQLLPVNHRKIKRERTPRTVERIDYTDTTNNTSDITNASNTSDIVNTSEVVDAFDSAEITDKLENSDMLLSQIDEFREKAQQLQTLLLSKESKAKELQSLVEERNEKAEELQQILEERQERADGITAEVGHKIDDMIVKISQKMNELSISMKEDLENGREVNERQAAMVKESVQSGSTKAEETFTVLNEVRTELFSMKDSIAQNQESIAKFGEECASIKEECESVKSELYTMKDEISEKVHTENVKSYRNMQDLLKGLEDQIEKIEIVNQNTKATKGNSKFLLWISIINFLTLVGYILYDIGVFNFI